MVYFEGKDGMGDALKDIQRQGWERRVSEIESQRDALLAFKTWVHAYLDARGIPTHPGGPHSAEGCRIGDRLELVFAELERLRTVTQAIKEMTDFNDPNSYASDDPHNCLEVIAHKVRVG